MFIYPDGSFIQSIIVCCQLQAGAFFMNPDGTIIISCPIMLVIIRKYSATTSLEAGRRNYFAGNTAFYNVIVGLLCKRHIIYTGLISLYKLTFVNVYIILFFHSFCIQYLSIGNNGVIDKGHR